MLPAPGGPAGGRRGRAGQRAEHHGAPARRREEVLIDLEPDEAQGVRGVVRVGDRLLASHRARRPYRASRSDHVVRTLLPVPRAGRAVRRANGGGRRRIESAERRRIAGFRTAESALDAEAAACAPKPEGAGDSSARSAEGGVHEGSEAWGTSVNAWSLPVTARRHSTG